MRWFTRRAGPRPHLLYPLFSPIKTSVHSDLLFPSITNDYYTEIGRDPLWEQKKYNQVLWRGETTGAYHAKGTGWRQTQRARLVQREHSTRFRFRAACAAQLTQKAHCRFSFLGGGGTTSRE